MPLLEPIMKGLIEWIYEMVVGIMEYAAKELVGVMSMDMAYFEQTAPVIKDITNIILALGWGMLIANMVFQSTKAMMSGVGFESEDPKHIFCRTFVFAFLLLASKQICNLAMGITGNVIELLQIPSARFFNPGPKYVRYQLKRKMAYSDCCRIYSHFSVYKTVV